VNTNVQDATVAPVDLAFSELLNADPFAEGCVEAMYAAKRLLNPGGRLVPQRLRVHVALVRAGGPSEEVRDAIAEVERLARAFDLDLGHLVDTLTPTTSYRQFSRTDELASTVATAWDVALGEVDRVATDVEAEVEILDPGPIGGAVIWFEADLDETTTMDNAPGRGGHWGQILCGWARQRGTRKGQKIRLHLTLRGTEVDVRW
jgi:hypothetical protein